MDRGRSGIRLLVLLVLAEMVLAAAPALANSCGPPPEKPSYELELQPGEPDYDHSHNARGIKAIVDKRQGYVAGNGHLHLGLSLAELFLSYETELFFWEPQGVGYCVALKQAKVTVGYNRARVLINRDYPEGSCEYDVIRTHEEAHVRINQEILAEYEPQFHTALKRLLKNRKTIFKTRKKGAEAAYIKAVKRALKPVMDALSAERDRRQARLDTPENYLRERQKCENWKDYHRDATTGAVSTTGPKIITIP